MRINFEMKQARLKSGNCILGCTLLLAALFATGVEGAEPPYNQAPRNEASLQRDLSRLERDPENPVLLREAGISLLLVGGPDNPEYAGRAKEVLEKSYRLNPDDAFTVMFLGCACGYEAREASILTRKALADRAFELMDRAVEMEPGSFRLRLMRATSGIQAPSWCARGKALEEDISYLRGFLEPEVPGELPDHLAAAGFLLLGNYHEANHEDEAAREYWEKSLSLNGAGRYRQMAEKKLRGISCL